MWEWHWQWQTAFSQLSTNNADEVSWHHFAHPCLWDRMWLMMNIVWHAFLAVSWVWELPKEVVWGQSILSWKWHPPRMGHLRACFFDEFWGLNSNLYCRVWIWITFEFRWKANNSVHNIIFAKHVKPLSSFGAFVGQCVLRVERAFFLVQASRCVMLWHSLCHVCVFLNLKKKGKKWILCNNFF